MVRIHLDPLIVLRWMDLGYERFEIEHPGDSPNAARFGDQGHYEIGNIHIVPQRVNAAEQAWIKPRPCEFCGNLFRPKRDKRKYCSRRCCGSAVREQQIAAGINANVGLVHGTRNCYTYHRCRCEKCREANRESVRRQRSQAKSA